MVPISSLWLPILLSAVIVFIASSIIHMVLGYHRSDYKKLPNETNLLESFGKESVQPGLYVFPHMASPKEMNSPEMLERYKKGPVGMMTILPNRPPSMGKHLALWFGYCILISIFVAYLTGRTTSSGADYLNVFRIAGTVAFLGHGVWHIVESIWRGLPWSSTIKSVIDGLVYALLTAGTFGWLWPR